MMLAFTLTLATGLTSWNGPWSRDGGLYVQVRNLGRSKRAQEHAKTLIGRHRYQWSDGWSACVDVREVDAAEARRLRSRSAGFCGNEWMIDSLLSAGEIRTPKAVAG